MALVYRVFLVSYMALTSPRGVCDQVHNGLTYDKIVHRRSKNTRGWRNAWSREITSIKIQFKILAVFAFKLGPMYSLFRKKTWCIFLQLSFLFCNHQSSLIWNSSINSYGKSSKVLGRFIVGLKSKSIKKPTTFFVTHTPLIILTTKWFPKKFHRERTIRLSIKNSFRLIYTLKATQNFWSLRLVFLLLKINSRVCWLC